jgi:ABC-2 type transport system permease protein
MNMGQHNLTNVISFEIRRTIKKRRFWIGMLAMPLLIVVIFALVIFDNNHAATTTRNQRNAHFTFEYFDQSGLIDPALVAKLKGHIAPSIQDGISAVKSGAVEAFFAYPAHPSKSVVSVYGIDKGVFENGTYASVALSILQTSVEQKIGSSELTAIERGGIKSTTITYKDGTVAGGINALIPSMLFLVVFYIIIILLGNQMLTSTLDEKENRVTEMILTTINPTNLILGKVISLFLLGVLQMAIFALPFVVGYTFFKSDLHLPNIDFSHLVFNPQQMTLGALMLLGGFALFTGTLVALGAAMPTAKDAGPIFGGLITLIFIPFYAFSLIANSPNALIVRIFSFFPYSAPVTGMLRNGFGTLPLWQGIFVVAELWILSAIVLRLAVRLFRYGSIEYSRKLSLREIFSA